MGCCDGSKNDKIQENVDNSDKIPERKIILIGDSGVGKSAIIYQFLTESNSGKKTFTPTQNVKNHYKVVDIPPGDVQDGKPTKIKLDIWDTAGDTAL